MAVESQQKVFGFYLPAGADGELFKQTILAYLAATFLTSIFFAFVLPRFVDLATARTEVRKLETKVDNLNKTLTALDQFGQGVTEDDRDALALAIPTRFDPGLILVSLRKLASDNGVSLTNYSLAGGTVVEEAGRKTEDRLISHLVKVEISGPPVNLINFVESLDNSLPIVVVSNLSISEISKILFRETADSRLAMDLTYYHLPLSVDAKASLDGKFLDNSDLEIIEKVAGFSRLPATGTQTTTTGKDSLFGL